MCPVIETALRLLAYTAQIGAIAAVAAILPAVVLLRWRRKKAAALLLLVCLSAEVVGLACLARHPVFLCPEEYRPFVSSEERRSLIDLNSGAYSKNIPFVPVCVAVTQADEVNITVRTYYFVFGCTEMEYGADRPILTRNIAGQP